MCLNPVRIRVRSKVLDMQGGQSYYTTVPCGHCAECLQHKRDEWQFRSHYHARSTIEKGGYIYFDTLTYDDANVPRISDTIDIHRLNGEFGFSLDSLNRSDFMCFNREDVKLFFKRLRRQLAYYGFKDSGCFDYFLTSEYGTSDVGTHRPHYHLLFFVHDPNLDPIVLSKLISKCWSYGRTDGIDYHSYHYVMDHVYGSGYTSDPVACQKACGYVSKYITKDSHYDVEIRHRIGHVMDRLFSHDWFKSHGLGFVDWRLMLQGKLKSPFIYQHDGSTVVLTGKVIKKLYDSLVKNCSQFHLQSQGFGADFLDYNERSHVFEDGLIYMPDPKHGVKFTSLPQYYQKKLFYDIQRDFNGHLYWSLNEQGREFKINRLKKNIDSLSLKLSSWHDSMKRHDYYCPDASWYDDILSRFDLMNDGRSFRQFATYLLCYKGRLKSNSERIRELTGVFKVDDLDDFLKHFFRPYDENSNLLYGYTSPVDRDHGLFCISDRWLGDSESWKVDGYSYYDNMHELQIRPWDFEKSYVIDQLSDPRFAFYDDMFDLYCKSQEFRNRFRQEGFDSKEDTQFRLKQIFRKS